MQANDTASHRLTIPFLRLGLGVFLALWGVDKLVATDGALGIFRRFYLMEVGQALVQALGVLEILLGLAIVFGFLRTLSYGLGLAADTVSTLASWKEILDPWGLIWGGGNAHLFLASIPVLAAFVVLFLNRRDEVWALDALRARRPAIP
ncbi:MAG: hypothetical protein HY702_00470 [Gemmatimonadetes bacterium]|nr:hypothetical protein [Gemmatimonadota bacterium]